MRGVGDEGENNTTLLKILQSKRRKEVGINEKGAMRRVILLPQKNDCVGGLVETE